jgi:hypothetical protein
MQGFCEKYYMSEANVEIFRKTPQGLDLASERKNRELPLP